MYCYRTYRRRYGLWRFFWDCFWSIATCGLWPFYLLLKALRRIGD